MTSFHIVVPFAIAGARMVDARSASHLGYFVPFRGKQKLPRIVAFLHSLHDELLTSFDEEELEQ